MTDPFLVVKIKAGQSSTATIADYLPSSQHHIYSFGDTFTACLRIKPLDNKSSRKLLSIFFCKILPVSSEKFKTKMPKSSEIVALLLNQGGRRTVLRIWKAHWQRRRHCGLRSL
jgi:hypothetical protein